LRQNVWKEEKEERWGEGGRGRTKGRLTENEKNRKYVQVIKF
jgi:hypothetical protein